MDYRWRYQDAAGNDTVGPDITFEDQDDAEEWLGRRFQDLLDVGVDQVVLMAGDDVVYGPMGLRPA